MLAMEVVRDLALGRLSSAEEKEGIHLGRMSRGRPDDPISPRCPSTRRGHWIVPDEHFWCYDTQRSNCCDAAGMLEIDDDDDGTMMWLERGEVGLE